MSDPLNVASCGECFESFATDAQPNYHPAEEVRLHAQNEGHRVDVFFQRVDDE
jgi:hypothetical protein